MIARGVQRTIDATEHPSAVMLDLRHLAVERCCAHHFAAEGLPDGLMTKTDTENRNGRRCFFDQCEANAGLIRGARAGRQHDGVRLGGNHVGHRDLVVTMHGDVRSKPSQIMEEIEGEAVVVVDEDDHVPPCLQGFTVGLGEGQGAPCSGGYWPRLAALANRRASSAARNKAFALLMHSCCSKSGLLSATMPAPACTYILPSFTSAVRSAMQVSISPAAEK